LRLTIAAGTLLAAMLYRRPTFAHFFLPAAYVTGAPLAFLARIPMRLMSRRSLNNYQGDGGLFRFLERRLHFTMNAVLGNSLAVVQQLLDEGVPKARLGLIYNGLLISSAAVSANREDQRGKLDLSATTLTLVIVANLIAYKGHADLIQALALAESNMPLDWHLLIVGRDDGIQDQLQRQTEEAGLAEHVRFLGARRDVPTLLAAADVGLLVSHEEGFSNAILEGMAAGLPMIVTDVGGNAEAVQHGVTGLIVPSKNPKELAAAILRLANDPAARAAFGEAGRRRVQEHFSLTACVDKYEELYRGLLRGDVPQRIPGIALGGTS
jgi:glycosyltransferase involved in cell wall biosynthesis